MLGGIPELLTLESQLTPELPFSRLGPSATNVIAPPSDRLDFHGAYGLYFWEIFFHAPFLVADSLSNNQRYAEARTGTSTSSTPPSSRKATAARTPSATGASCRCGT